MGYRQGTVNIGIRQYLIRPKFMPWYSCHGIHNLFVQFGFANIFLRLGDHIIDFALGTGKALEQLEVLIDNDVRY